MLMMNIDHHDSLYWLLGPILASAYAGLLQRATLPCQDMYIVQPVPHANLLITVPIVNPFKLDRVGSDAVIVQLQIQIQFLFPAAPYSTGCSQFHPVHAISISTSNSTASSFRSPAIPQPICAHLPYIPRLFLTPPPPHT